VSHQYLVVWYNEWPGGFRDIYAQRLTSSGKLLSHFTVATGAGGDERNRWLPALAYNALLDEYLVVYMRDVGTTAYEVWGRRVSWDGALLGAEVQYLNSTDHAFWGPRIAWNRYANEYHLVANARATTIGLWDGVVGLRVPANGSAWYAYYYVSGPSQAMQCHAGDIAASGVLSPGYLAEEYLVVWRQRYSDTDWDIYGAYVNSTGAVWPYHFPIDMDVGDQDNPSVTSNGIGRYAVAWQHYLGSDWAIRGAIYNLGETTPASTLGADSISADEEYPAVAFSQASARPVVAMLSHYPSAPNAVKVYDGNTHTLTHINGYAALTPPQIALGPPAYLVVYARYEGLDTHIWGRLLLPATVYLPLVIRNGS